ncbi:MAG: mechanosensitive ion channel family protein [Trueperaceae bacterium]
MNARSRLRLARWLACAAILGSTWVGAAEPIEIATASTGVELAADLGPWTDDVDLAAELRTPRSALQTFLEAGAVGRYELAAAVLNLSDLSEADRRDRGPDLAEKLYFVLDRRLAIEWREVPDRPDGARDQAAASVEGEVATAPAPRHNLRIGEVSGGTAPVEIRLERMQTTDLVPVWLIARSTVRSIDALYEQHGPGWIERNAPAWTLTRYGATPVWQWLGFVLLVALSIALGMGLQRLALRGLASSTRPRVRDLVGHVARPLAALATVSVLWLASSTLLSLSGAAGRWVSTALAALFVVAVTWLAKNAANSLAELVVQKWLGGWGESDATGTQRRRTNLSVARRTIVFVVLLVGIAIALAQFAAFRTVGTSLLASAGVAGIVLGVAAQDSLSNVVAGIQIALTKLIRIGDAVFFEEHWSKVEDITYTFVILRTWDGRRIAVPNRYLIVHPIQNWSMTDPNMIMPVILHVDYRTPVEALRRRYVEVLEATEDWDRVQEPKLQVIEATQDTLKVRVLCSAEDASTAWDLHCHVREELVAFVRDWDDGRYLPRSRVRIEGEGAIADASAAADAG